MTQEQIKDTYTGKKFLPIDEKKPRVDQMLDWILRIKDRRDRDQIPESFKRAEMSVVNYILGIISQDPSAYTLSKNEKQKRND